MNAAVRALSLLLIAWLTAAASFPPCCWSMAGAHDHQAQQPASTTSAQPHSHHHGNADSASLAASVRLLSADPSHLCETETMEAVVTPRASLSSIDLDTGAWVHTVITPASAVWRERFDAAPPGGSSRAAFLNPLRI